MLSWLKKVEKVTMNFARIHKHMKSFTKWLMNAGYEETQPDDPPPDTVDYISGWTCGKTQTGFALVEHLTGGDTIFHALDVPQYGPKSLSELKIRGWQEVTGSLFPQVEQDGHLVPTGQEVFHFVRPILDDFMLIQVIRSPGEDLSVRKLMPKEDFLVTCSSDEELLRLFPEKAFTRFRSPQEVGWGLSAL